MGFPKRAGLLAGLAAALSVPATAAAAAPANVTVRVEGAQQTVLAETPVRTRPQPVSKTTQGSCSGTSAIGALELATDGNWSGRWQGGQSVEAIKGVSYPFDPAAPRNYYWTFWVNGTYQNLGACDRELQEGDEVLFSVGCFGDCATPAPLRLQAPATARPGTPVTLVVTEYPFTVDATYNGTTTARNSAGATVRAGAASATTGADGRAQLALDQRGPVEVTVAKEGFVRAERTVCVTDGADGFCGTVRAENTSAPAPEESQPVAAGQPGQPSAGAGGPVAAGAPCATTGADGRCGTRDRTAPRATIARIAMGDRFSVRRAPRVLSGRVSADSSGLLAVKLRLTWRRGHSCGFYSARREAFRRARCGSGLFFGVGDRANWSYLLPQKLAKGRYVLEVVAIDRAYNRDAVASGRNRVVFRVR